MPRMRSWPRRRDGSCAATARRSDRSGSPEAVVLLGHRAHAGAVEYCVRDGPPRTAALVGSRASATPPDRLTLLSWQLHRSCPERPDSREHRLMTTTDLPAVPCRLLGRVT